MSWATPTSQGNSLNAAFLEIEARQCQYRDRHAGELVAVQGEAAGRRHRQGDDFYSILIEFDDGGAG